MDMIIYAAILSKTSTVFENGDLGVLRRFAMFVFFVCLLVHMYIMLFVFIKLTQGLESKNMTTVLKSCCFKPATSLAKKKVLLTLNTKFKSFWYASLYILFLIYCFTSERWAVSCIWQIISFTLNNGNTMTSCLTK